MRYRHDFIEAMVDGLSPAAAPCPKCGERGNMRYEWKPDMAPTRERLRCYRCGWDTDWIRYGTCKAVAA